MSRGRPRCGGSAARLPGRARQQGGVPVDGVPVDSVVFVVLVVIRRRGEEAAARRGHELVREGESEAGRPIGELGAAVGEGLIEREVAVAEWVEGSLGDPSSLLRGYALRKIALRNSA